MKLLYSESHVHEPHIVIFIGGNVIIILTLDFVKLLLTFGVNNLFIIFWLN